MANLARVSCQTRQRHRHRRALPSPRYQHFPRLQTDSRFASFLARVQAQGFEKERNNLACYRSRGGVIKFHSGPDTPLWAERACATVIPCHLRAPERTGSWHRSGSGAACGVVSRIAHAGLRFARRCGQAQDKDSARSLVMEAEGAVQVTRHGPA